MGKVKDLHLRIEEEELSWALGYEEWLMDNDQNPTAIELDQMAEDLDKPLNKYNNCIISGENIMKTKTIITNDEMLEINAETGEILVTGDINEFNRIRTTKIKALMLLTENDFVKINGVWEPKRDGLIKILSSLPISYSWEITAQQLKSEYAQVTGTLSIQNGNTTRSCDSMGVCEMRELVGHNRLHFMNARAETRALKQAIETLFGSVINYYVIHHLEAHQQRYGAA